MALGEEALEEAKAPQDLNLDASRDPLSAIAEIAENSRLVRKVRKRKEGWHVLWGSRLP